MSLGKAGPDTLSMLWGGDWGRGVRECGGQVSRSPRDAERPALRHTARGWNQSCVGTAGMGWGTQKQDRLQRTLEEGTGGYGQPRGQSRRGSRERGLAEQRVPCDKDIPVTWGRSPERKTAGAGQEAWEERTCTEPA